MIVESILIEKGTDVVTTTPEASVWSAANWLRVKDIGALVVMDREETVGLIGEREIVRAFCEFGESVGSKSVKDVMTRRLITVAPDDNVTHVMKLMTRHRVRHTPVLRNRKLVGIVSIGDVVKHRLQELELELHVMRDAYVAGR